DNEDKRVPLGEILAGSKADYLGEGVSDEPEVWDGASALPEGASVVGKYDTGTIRRYMRPKLPRIRYCYEKELIKQSNLEGTVVAQFSINKDGKVRNAKASGMGSKVVEKCIAKAISSIRFPIPKSGSSTKVRYPFTFPFTFTLHQ
ncbi:MAG: AgmX/PglI C-terminal domain-containing protein, partial [Kofleriaceae bacterium]|nr:AgmX/PglI C-terminal domain-containing protein [Kofleriaceae bacterium]